MAFNSLRFADKIFVYMDYAQETSWTNSLAWAHEQGGTWALAAIGSAEEQAAVQSIVAQKAWIGLVQTIGSPEPGGGWSWSDGTAIVYSHWAAGEPNNAGQVENWGEMGTSGFWNDMPNGYYNRAAVFQVSALSSFELAGSFGTDMLRGGDGNDSLMARLGDDTLLGGAGDDSLSGGGGANLIEGGAGNDTLSSGGGADSLEGGAGADLLMAGAGLDTFVFSEAGDSTRGAIDRIRYFNDAVDQIDLGALSDSLHLGMTRRFHGEAGEIVLRQQAKSLLVLLDIDGDGLADMALRLGGTHELTEANFLLA